MFSAQLLSAGDIAPGDWERCMPGEAEGQAYYAACEGAPPEGFELSALAVFGAQPGPPTFRFAASPPLSAPVSAEGEPGGSRSGRLVALCPVFRLNYNLATAVQGGLRRAADAVAKLFPRLLHLSLIGLGSPVGERCHIGFAPELDDSQKREVLLVMLDALAVEAKRHKIGMVGIKDLAETDNKLLAASLKSRGFTHVNSLPVAVLDLAGGGEDGYFDRLSPAMRKDLRRKLKKAGSVRIEQRVSIDGIEAQIDALFHATRENSVLDYGAFEDLPPGYFTRMMRALGPRAFLMLYYAEGELAAFNLMLRDDTRLIDKFWGMRRDLARRHDLYFISWMANVRLCLAQNIPLLQTGQTAYAAKLRLGSRLVPSHVWFRHRNFVLDRMLRLLARFIAYDQMDPDLKALAQGKPKP